MKIKFTKSMDVEFTEEMIKDNSILASFIECKSTLPYVEWLENMLEENVPNCMKFWVNEDDEKFCF